MHGAPVRTRSEPKGISMLPLKHRVRAILGFKTTVYAALLAGAKNIYTKMSSAVQQFPSPTVTMAAFLILIQVMETAQSGVNSRTKGQSTVRNNAAKALILALEGLLSYVQGLADASNTAATIIAAAGMKVRAVSQHAKAPLTLTNGKPSGTVIMRAYATLLTGAQDKSGAYSWQYSVDGQKTWVTLPPTSIARTSITGLASTTTVAARVAVSVGKQPISDWSPVVTLVVA